MKRSFLIILSLIFSIIAFPQISKDVRQLIYNERYNSAAQSLHSILKGNPDNVEAWYLLITAYCEQNRVQEIKDSLQKAPQAVLNDPLIKSAYGHILLKENRVADAKQNFDAALKETRQKNAAVLAEIAKAYIDVKAADAHYAIELLNEAIRRDKHNPELYVLLGDAFSKLSNGSDAYSAYKKALDMDANYARASYRLGKIFTSQKNPIYMKYFEDALHADALYAPALYEIYYHYYFRDVVKAMEYLKKYIAASDYSRENDYLITDMLYLNKDYNAAINKGQQLINEEGDSVAPRVYKLVANSYKKSSDYDNARNYMENYFAKNTDTTYLVADYETMGEIYDSLVHHEDSAAHYYGLASELTTKEADRYRLYKKIANLYAKEKNYEKQAMWLQKYCSYNPGATNVDLFNCGIAYYNAGEYNLADSAFGVYSEKYPDQKYGYYWRARSNVAIDTAMERGLAIPYYLKVIEIAEKDTTDELNRKRLIESYGYIASFRANHDKDYATSKEYFEKVIALQPDNEDAKKYVILLDKFISGSVSN